jgi:acyl-CoA oxidase
MTDFPIIEYWVDKGVLQMPERIIGCFGMTELEHGSNVAGLLTTATLDKKTDEFIIHTPHLGATKWWIGGAASSATHCSVFAQLVVDGKKYGTKTFVVPIRNPKTFDTLPGILIGDIGKKMGRDGVDNGYLQFSYVRIPREYMMMRHTQVSKDGKVVDTAAPQAAYGALIGGRVGMVTDSAVISQKGLTIAIRYGIVRRQFSAGSSDVETQILDYPIHQRRLMPLLAQSIAFGFASKTLQAKYEHVMDHRAHLGPSELDPKNHAAEIKELHVMAAGLKVSILL